MHYIGKNILFQNTASKNHGCVQYGEQNILFAVKKIWDQNQVGDINHQRKVDHLYCSYRQCELASREILVAKKIPSGKQGKPE